jgi:hypothetical protein
MSVVSVNVRILEPHGDLGQTQPLPRASIPLIVVPFVFFWDLNNKIHVSRIMLASSITIFQIFVVFTAPLLWPALYQGKFWRLRKPRVYTL